MTASLAHGQQLRMRSEAPAALGRLISLDGTVLPRLARAERLGAFRTQAPMTVTVALRPRNVAGLEALIRRMNTPGALGYRQFLTPEQFAARFAPPAIERSRVAAWL